MRTDITDELICLFFGRRRTGEEIGRDPTDLRTKVPQQQEAWWVTVTGSHGPNSPLGPAEHSGSGPDNLGAHQNVIISYKIRRGIPWQSSG